MAAFRRQWRNVQTASPGPAVAGISYSKLVATVDMLAFSGTE